MSKRLLVGSTLEVPTQEPNPHSFTPRCLLASVAWCILGLLFCLCLCVCFARNERRALHWVWSCHRTPFPPRFHFLRVPV